MLKYVAPKTDLGLVVRTDLGSAGTQRSAQHAPLHQALVTKRTETMGRPAVWARITGAASFGGRPKMGRTTHVVPERRDGR